MTADEDDLPSFPSLAVRNRLLELGFGSGLWIRADLEGKWGASAANKFIDEAKSYGWIVSPFRGEFWVPTAADLMVVPWLSPTLREEFILSRALKASGLKFWSFSEWARSEGLLFPRPLFVTDLSSREEPTTGRLPMNELEIRVRARADLVRKIPFLDRLIVVPELGKLGPAKPSITSIGRGRPKRVPAFTTREAEISGGPERANETTAPTAIRYTIGPSLNDPAWLIAFLLALDLSRTNTILRKLADEATARRPRRVGKRRPAADDILAEARRLSGRFGPPLPNEDWRTLLKVAEFPFFLVPPDIWQDIAVATASRRFKGVDALGGAGNA